MELYGFEGEMNTHNEIILYQSDEAIEPEVHPDEDIVWLNRQQTAVLFDRDVKTIGKHIANALMEELSGIPTVAKFATVQKEGKRQVIRNVEYCNFYDGQMLEPFSVVNNLIRSAKKPH